MKDLMKLTSDEANKLECALLMLHDTIHEYIGLYAKMAQDMDLKEKTRAVMQSNSEWWQEVYTMLYDEKGL